MRFSKKSHGLNEPSSLRKKTLLLLLSAAVIALFTGCSPGTLPEPAPAGNYGKIYGALIQRDEAFSFKSEAGTVFWWAADNTPQERRLSDEEVRTGCIILPVRKGSVTPVLLYPDKPAHPEEASVNSQPAAAHPAGCIWPVSSVLDEDGGFASRMLWRLLSETEAFSGDTEQIRGYCAHFNWKRFSEEIQRFEDPWELDQQRILIRIADGTFSLKDLKLAEP